MFAPSEELNVTHASLSVADAPLAGHRAPDGAPPTAVSHGCIRLTTAAITWLAERVGRGVPVTVTA